MSESRVRVWFALFVLVVFAVGLAGGILIGRNLSADRPFHWWRGPRDAGPEFAVDGRRGGPLRRMLIDRLSRELDLTPEQKIKIDGELAATRTRLERLQKEARDRYDTERRAVRDEIRKVLTPEQLQKFDQTERDGRSRGGRRGR